MEAVFITLIILYLTTLFFMVGIFIHVRRDPPINPVSFVIILCPIINTVYTCYLVSQLSISVDNVFVSIKKKWTKWCKQTFIFREMDEIH